MSTDYTQVFGNYTITPSQTGFLPLTIANDYQLFWPTPGNNIPTGSTTEATVCAYNNIISTVTAKSVFMPSAKLVSTGTAVVFTNVGGMGDFAFNVKDYDGSVIVSVAVGSAVLLYLTDNSTDAGEFTNVPYAGGVSAVTAIGLLSSPSNNGNITISSSASNPITSTGNFTITLANDLLALSNLGSDVGYAVRTAANTWANRTFTFNSNHLSITDPSGVAAATNFALNPNITTLQSITLASGLAIASNTLSNTSGNLIIDPALLAEFTGSVQIDSGNALRFYEPTATFYTSFAAGDLGANISYTWPTNVPSIGQVLSILAPGTPNTLQWATVPTFPGVSLLHSIARYSNITGSLEDSGVVISDTNDVTGVDSITSGNVIVSANTISTASGPLILDPNGISPVVITGLTYPLSTDTGNIESCVPTANGLDDFIFSANVNENLLINGAMDIWQRGTSFTNATFFVNNSGITTADCYRLESGIGAGIPVNEVVNISKVARAYNTATCSFDNVMRFTVTATGNKFVNFQFIESSTTAKVAGQVASFSIVCAASIGATIRAAMISFSGTADTIPKPIITTFNAAGTNPTLSANWAYIGSAPTSTTITTSLTRFKFENLTVPSNTTNLAIMVWYDAATAPNATTFDIGGLKVEQGPSCTAFQPRPLEVELQLCERRFGKDLPLSVAVGTPGTTSSNMFIPIIGAFPIPASGGGGDTDFTSIYGDLSWDVEMRTTPTVTFYSCTAGTVGMASEYISDGAGTPLYTDYAANTAIAINADTKGCRVRNQSAGTIAVATAGFNVVAAHHYRTADL